MKLFYNLNLNHNDKELTLFDSEHSHLTKVLRKKIDEIVYLTNGRGYLFEAMIVQINSKDTKLKILSSLKKPKMNYYLNVAISPTKKNDRFEWFIEKAVEIGVSSITPIISTYTERKTLNYSRLNKIAVSAMKQSFQTYLPVINPISDFYLIDCNVQYNY
jgi:16S rRNA (uracil1498-N3)-methyltransferase